MAARRTRGAFRGGRQAPRTDWARLVSAAPVTVAAGTKVLIATFTLSNAGISETVRRTRGVVSISSDQSASVEEQYGAFGMVVCNDLALAAGAASIPGPVTDASDDGWFVWVPFMQTAFGASTTNPSREYQFDSKGMRTIDDGFGIAVMVENAHASEGLRFAIGMSLLGSRR